MVVGSSNVKIQTGVALAPGLASGVSSPPPGGGGGSASS